MKKIYYIIIGLLSLGCGKQFLDKKPAKNLVVMNKISDYQGLIDRTNVMNADAPHTLALISIDDYYVKSEDWNSVSSILQRNAYIWNDEIFEGEDSRDWNNAYERVFYANTAIEGLDGLPEEDKNEVIWKDVKAMALFQRALGHYQVAVLFAGTDMNSALGVPIRSESDINIPVVRATVSETYRHILRDLEQALDLFSDEPYVPTRPTKESTLMLLAKIHLYLENYDEAFWYANEVLSINAELINFNELELDGIRTFPVYGEGNKEIVFNAWTSSITILTDARMSIDTNLYAMYEENDLRKDAYFMNVNGDLKFKGSYVGYALGFAGLSRNECYLIAMEAAVRTEQFDQAITLYNELRRNRFREDNFIPLGTVSDDTLLELILTEKRKELVMRSSRWEDLKRLNRNLKHQTTLLRNINGQQYRLPPNDSRYIMPIPDEVVRISNVIQNIR